MVLRSVESSLAQVLRTILGVSSGPSALDIVRFNKSFSTPLESMVMFQVDGIFSLTNLEENYLKLVS